MYPFVFKSLERFTKITVAIARNSPAIRPKFSDVTQTEYTTAQTYSAESMMIYPILKTTQRQRVSDGETAPVLSDTDQHQLVLVWPQLGDFDSLEYAWWLQRAQSQLQAQAIAVRAVGIGDRASGQRFCDYTGFPPENLFVDPHAVLHQTLGLYPGLSITLPGLAPGQTAWLNLMLMCAGIGSPGTLAEVLRGYTGDRQAPQLIAPEESVQAGPLPPLQGKVFNAAGA
jgi:hypothetical protein